MEDLSASNTSTLNISGGSVAYVGAWGSSTIKIIGYDFRATDGANIINNEIIGTGILAGNWFDGESFSIDINTNHPTATIMLIPEPGTLLLFGLGGLTLRRKTRR